MSSSDSDLYRYTASNERVDELIRKNRQIRLKSKLDNERKRERYFKEYYELEKGVEESIFNYPGLYFLEFNHKKIKFRFTPSQVVENIGKNDKFYCSLWYKYNKWSIKRNSFPSDCKATISNLFVAINDSKVLNIINSIYEVLLKWSNDYKRLLQERFERYLDGDEDIVLDSMEEELFLDKKEIEEIHRKRNVILERMKTLRN
ncbi:uncharacterized protein [Onthophagus taurus]|uniref:uncharacterized protein isoform X1 n=1 Tax=Onthophagus taurus TaxID=166361 RepID=UPI000C20F37B|nr:uncharacterized protein LOC111417274 [Onthophagus taurus]